jgi:phosphatidylinositol-3-phosphatase
MAVKYISVASSLLLWLLLPAACGRDKPSLVGTGGIPDAASAAPAIEGTTTPHRVFVVSMENHNWVDIKGSASAPYLNGLLGSGAHADQYFNPPEVHPSEPNYLWLEAGTRFGIVDDNPPSINHQGTTSHLTALLRAVGISWKSYQEDISGTVCPLSPVARYDPRHNPFVFFDDNTGNGDVKDAFCIAHNRPYSELAGDLLNDTTPSYVFITPNLCNIMHDTCAPQLDAIKQGDDWLSRELPKVLSSKAWHDGAYVFIIWDEGEAGSDGPIGMIALSKNVKPGYVSSLPYTHSSALRTIQEIFGVTPLLGDAVNATDLADLFTTFP